LAPKKNTLISLQKDASNTVGRVNNYPLYSVNWIKLALRDVNWRR